MEFQFSKLVSLTCTRFVAMIHIVITILREFPTAVGVAASKNRCPGPSIPLPSSNRVEGMTDVGGCGKVES